MQEIKSPPRLTFKILVGMGLGILVGTLLKLTGLVQLDFVNTFFTQGLFHLGGRVFVASLQLLVVPLVFVSLVCGTAALDDIKKLGRVGGKTILLYLMTTCMAITLALAMGALVKPGAGFDLESSTKVEFQASEAPPLVETLIAIFPTNPIQAMAQGNMLQLIVFSILFGLAITMSGKAGTKVAEAFESLNQVIMHFVMMMMWAAPYGVFCLIAKVFAEQGFSAIVPLAKYFFVVLFALIIHALVVYPSVLRVFGKLSPKPFLAKFRRVWVFAFSTASSNATIPVTLNAVEKRLGVSNSIASFTVPLGATINMDGTAIMQGVATAFIAQAYGIDIGIMGYLMVVLTATLSSIGTAGVPGVGLITLAMVLNQVGLPVEGIGLIIGVDRLLDMVRTAVNITGDAVVTCVVAQGESQLDNKIYEAEHIG
jgi:Na+/H+-dicarboxylate symporter